MTESEAIAELRNMQKFNYTLAPDEVFDMAIAALEKQSGKKPIDTHYAHMWCPVCNHRIQSGCGSSNRRRDNWCNYCGQLIDWSDEHGAD